MIELGDLGLDEGAHFIIKHALASAATVEVRGSSPERQRPSDGKIAGRWRQFSERDQMSPASTLTYCVIIRKICSIIQLEA